MKWTSNALHASRFVNQFLVLFVKKQTKTKNKKTFERGENVTRCDIIVCQAVRISDVITRLACVANVLNAFQKH